MDKSLAKISKFLSFVLRHSPEAIGLELDPEGWADIQDIIDKSEMPLSKEIIHNVVKTNDKQRFALSKNGLLIRANQGHSIVIDLGLTSIEPPEILYHGTAVRFVESIKNSGLTPQSRQYVHLSSDEDTAQKVGQRHGKPVILKVQAKKMYEQGYEFYQAKNGVWLTKSVGIEYLQFDIKN